MSIINIGNSEFRQIALYVIDLMYINEEGLDEVSTSAGPSGAKILPFY